MPAGRPRKYREKQTIVSVYIPLTLLEEIEERAAKSGLTRTEMLHSIIVSADVSKAELLAKKFNFLSEQIAKLDRAHKDCIKELMKFKGECITESVYSHIEPDEISIRAFNEVKPDFVKVWEAHEGRLERKIKDSWINITVNKMEVIAASEGKVIKNMTLARQMVRMLFIREFEGF